MAKLGVEPFPELAAEMRGDPLAAPGGSKRLSDDDLGGTEGTNGADETERSLPARPCTTPAADDGAGCSLDKRSEGKPLNEKALASGLSFGSFLSVTVWAEDGVGETAARDPSLGVGVLLDENQRFGVNLEGLSSEARSCSGEE